MDHTQLHPNINLEEFIRLTGTRLRVPVEELDKWCERKLSVLYEAGIRDMNSLQLTAKDTNAWNELALTTVCRLEIETALSELLLLQRKPVTNSNDAPYTDKYGQCIGVGTRHTMTDDGLRIEKYVTTYLDAEVTEICKNGYVVEEIIEIKKSPIARFYL